MSSNSTTLLGSVLVIGGCGFLGHHIVSHLLELPSPPTVSVLDLRTTRNRFDSVTYFDGDICSRHEVEKVLQEVKPQVVIHTASPIHSLNNFALYKRVNVDGTRNLLECAGEAGCVKAFVFTSSSSIVHDSVSDLVNADETYPILRRPVQQEIYSESKGMAEEVVTAANRKYGNMLTTSIRPAGIIGEGDVQIIPNMLKAYYKGQTKFQLGENDNLFDFTYVANIVHAHVLAAEALLMTAARRSPPLDHEKVDGEAFHITNDQPVYFWDFARWVWTSAGDQIEPKDVWKIPKSSGLVIATIIEWIFWILFFGRRKPNLTRQQVNYSSMTRTYNIEKAKKRLGYKPIVNLQEGIERTVRWFEEQRQAELEKKAR